MGGCHSTEDDQNGSSPSHTSGTESGMRTQKGYTVTATNQPKQLKSNDLGDGDTTPQTLDLETAVTPVSTSRFPATKDEVQVIACEVEELKDGQMKEVEIAGDKCLLVRDNGEFHAIGHKCTHFGAPLVKGALANGRVRCPWHGACFNIRTGDIEDFPGLDSVQKFDVDVSDGKVRVRASQKAISTKKRVQDMTCCSPDDNRVFLIIGGGGASVSCAETLRQQGFKGKVIIATKEGCMPYDRTTLSKALSKKAEDVALRNLDFYSVYDIEVKTGFEATSVDPVLKAVSFGNGQKITYDKLLIATGGSPRTLNLPGSDLENVCVLRTPEDANKIARETKGKNVVIIGTSFIGMELAAYAIQNKADSVTVLGRSDVPFKQTLGEDIGKMWKQVRMELAASVVEQAKSVTALDIVDIPFKLVLGEAVGSGLKKFHESKGVKFIAGTSSKEFVGDSGKLTEVVLEDDTRLPADVVVMGVGVFPATAFLKESGIEVCDNGYVTVNKHLQTNRFDVFAAGDIVEFPLFTCEDRVVNVQHWQMALAHGRCAALNMLDQEQEIRSVPFFWTMMYGKSVRYTGFGAGHDDIVMHGNPEDRKFVAFYTKDDKVVAVSSLDWDPICAQAAEMFYAGKNISKQEIQESPDGWVSRLN